MAIAVRSTNRGVPKIIDVGPRDGQTQDEADEEVMNNYLKTNPSAQMFRVDMSNPKQIVLQRVRVQPGSEVTEIRVVSATFEDDT